MHEEESLNAVSRWGLKGDIMLAVIAACFLLGGAREAPASSAEVQQRKDSAAYPMSALRRVDFNYLVYANDLVMPDHPEVCTRNLYVLMDETAFNEPNLRELFSVLSDAFPRPGDLTVTVRTSLEQVRPLGEVGISEEPDLPNADKHHRAGYLRLGGNEFFRYTEHSTDLGLKTVVLKGTDPATGLRAPENKTSRK
jgi:hypothetical protein